MRLFLPVLLFAAASTSTAAAEPVRTVRGLDGQADLRLDLGRRLPARLGGSSKSSPASGAWLTSLEKARLDARRVAQASSLDDSQKLQRLIAIVRHRLRPDEVRYERLSRLLVSRSGTASLSRYVAARTGLCREQAFLLQALLREAGVRAKVRYGLLYDDKGGFLGGHAWAEARLPQGRMLLDPATSIDAHSLQPLSIDEQLADGSHRHTIGRRAAGLLYVPTPDLEMVRSGNSRAAPPH